MNTVLKAVFAVIGAFVFFFFGLVYSFVFLTPTYRSTARVLVEQPPSEVVSGNTNLETAEKLAKSIPVGRRAAKILYPEVLSDEMAAKKGIVLMNAVKIDANTATGIFTIIYEGRNPMRCADRANAYARAFSEVYPEYMEMAEMDRIDKHQERLDEIGKDLLKLEKRLEKAEPGSDEAWLIEKELELIQKAYDKVGEDFVQAKMGRDGRLNVRFFEEAMIPQRPIRPNRQRIILLFTVSGILAGTVFAHLVGKKKKGGQNAAG